MEEKKREINYVSLSKAMSKALRHRPERLGITLEKDGSVELDVFVDALNRRGGWPRTITEADIMEVVDNGSKKRFAVEGGRIRARYGHSIKADIAYAPADPPEILFHGTAPSSVASIMRQGLLPMGRKTVHLSTDVETARKVILGALKPLMTVDKYGRQVVDPTYPIDIRFDGFGDSSVNLVVVLYTTVDTHYTFPARAKEAIYKAFNENGIEIPFPQRDVYVKSVPFDPAGKE